MFFSRKWRSVAWYPKLAMFCPLYPNANFRLWDARVLRKWGRGGKCSEVASSTCSSWSGWEPSTSSGSASSPAGSSWEDRFSPIAYKSKQQLCAGQVLPNRTEPGDAQSRNQPPAVFQKAVILLIGATELFWYDKIKMMLTTANLRTISFQMHWNMTSVSTTTAFSIQNHIRYCIAPFDPQNSKSIHVESGWPELNCFPDRTSFQFCKPCPSPIPPPALPMESFSSKRSFWQVK